MLRAIGILGGTFDPIHYAHLRLAQEVAERFQLQEVRFVPAGSPWHRNAPLACVADRVAMLELAIAGNSKFRIDRRELGKDNPSYTVVTLQEIRAELSREQPLALLLGADQVAVLHTWHRWRELFDLAHLIRVNRAASHPKPLPALEPDVAEELERRTVRDAKLIHGNGSGWVFDMAMTPLAISATQIRTELAAGRTSRYLLPEAVLEYIQTHRLYRQE